MRIPVVFPKNEHRLKVNFGEVQRVGEPVLIDGEFAENGEYLASDKGANGYGKVIVNVQRPLQNKTITENGKYAADEGYYGLKEVNVNIPWETQFWVGVMFGGDVYGGVNAGSITLPDGLTEIPANAFMGRKDLTQIHLPNGITIIRDGAFRACVNLETVSLPNTLEEIEGDAFISCSKLVLKSLPAGVKRIGGSAFAYCSNLSLYYLPSAIENIGSYAFYMVKTQWGADFAPNRLYLYENIKTIGNYAFGGCSGFNTVYFKGTPVSISPTAFADCPNVGSIYVPWAEGEVANAPWGATNATIYYNQTS